MTFFFNGTITTSMAMFFFSHPAWPWLGPRGRVTCHDHLGLATGVPVGNPRNSLKRESWIDSEWEIKIDMIYLIRIYTLWFFKIAMKTMGTCIDEHNNDFITNINQYLMIMLETYLTFFYMNMFQKPTQPKKKQQIKTTTMWGPLDVSWFISPINMVCGTYN